MRKDYMAYAASTLQMSPGLARSHKTWWETARGAGSLGDRRGAQSSFTSRFLFMGWGSWEGTRLSGWWAEPGACQGSVGGLPWGGTACLWHQALGREDGDTQAWQRLLGRLAKGGHLGATPELAEDGGPSAAEAGSALLPATEGRCLLHLLMRTYRAGVGNRQGGARTHLNKALSNLI